MNGRYYATISHHSISRAHEVDCGDDLDAAKKIADDEFGDGFLDHTIVICERSNGDTDEPVASRRIGDEDWDD